MHGWAKAKDCRQREVDRQVERLIAEIRQVQRGLPPNPVLGSSAAESLLTKWVPDIVGRFALDLSAAERQRVTAARRQSL